MARMMGLSTSQLQVLWSEMKKGQYYYLARRFVKGFFSDFAAEAIACRKVVQVGFEQDWPKIIVEGDSLTVIKKCKRRVKIDHILEHKYLLLNKK